MKTEKGKLSRDPAFHHHMEVLSKLAKEKGGSIAPGEIYRGYDKKMEFIDKSGRRFKMLPYVVKRGAWSPYEAGNSKDKEWQLRRIQEIAAKRGGSLREGQEYLGAHKKLRFVDRFGYEFEMTPSNLKKVGEPPFKERRILEPAWHMKELEKIANLRGGEVLAGEKYEGARKKIRFKDAAGNIFCMLPRQVKKGGWSPYEANLVRDGDYHLAKLAAIAEKKGGRLVQGQKYVNGKGKLLFIDKLDNEFQMTSDGVKKGNWSQFEVNKVRDASWQLKEIERIAKARGGRLLPNQQYAGCKKKLWFEDGNGFKFAMSSQSLKTGRWSPKGGQVSEHVCRQAIEYLFSAKFPQRWGVVRRPNGRALELDGFCERLKMAFEYQGYRHTENEDQKIRDEEKRSACKKAGITLIEIPEMREGGEGNRAKSEYSLFVASHVRARVISALMAAGRPVPNMEPVEMFVADLRQISHCVRKMAELVAYVEKNHPGGGIDEGEFYASKDGKMRFRDKAGRRFAMSPREVRRGSWSPHEVPEQVRRRGEEKLLRIVKGLGWAMGEGAVYVNHAIPLLFLDEKNRPVKISPTRLYANIWHLKNKALLAIQRRDRRQRVVSAS